MKEINNIFEWLNEITYNKTPVKEISEDSWEKFNNYMINRFVSFEPKYLDLVSIAQTIHPQDKEKLYSFYCKVLPKQKKFFRYMKPKEKGISDKLIYYITQYFECGKEEAITYYKLLDKNQVLDMLQNLGVDPKEGKKLIK